MSIKPVLPRARFSRPAISFLVPLAVAVLATSMGVFGGLGTAQAADDPPFAQYQEMHANCRVNHALNDDPIVFPGLAGASHNHSFIGNANTNAGSTPRSLVGGPTSCQDTKDASGYWFPTLLQNGTPVPVDQPTVYYKSGVKDYRKVKPFPAGFKLLVGDLHTVDAAHFQGNWQCTGYKGNEIPSSCPSGASLIVHLKAPSCWDGVNLDTTDHKSHMVWPVGGVCPADHPVALPMLEVKIPYHLTNGNTSGMRYSSGASYSFHYDFMNGWDAARQASLVAYCINGGRQCNGYGEDPKKP